MSTSLEAAIARDKRRNGLLYGILAGLAFSAAAWGWDTYQLSRASVALPWLKLAAGSTIALLVSGLAGWLTARFDRPLISIGIWAIAGLFLTWVGSHLPYEIYSLALGYVNPELAQVASYPYPESRQGLLAFAGMIVVVGALIGGGLQMYFVDSATYASAPMGRVMPLLVTLPIYATLGLAGVDVMYNQPLREPIFTIHELFQFWIKNRDVDLDARTRRNMRLGSLGMVENVIQEPYTLALRGYSDDLTSVNVVADFSGSWVQCMVVGEVPANQVTTCKPLDPARAQTGPIPGAAPVAPGTTPTPSATPGDTPDASQTPSPAATSKTGESGADGASSEGVIPSQELAWNPDILPAPPDLAQAPRYDLDLQVDFAERRLNGTLHLGYTNTEAEPLDRIYFHVLPNDGGSAYGNGSLNASLVEVNGQAVQAVLEKESVLLVPLPQPLAPGESIQVRMAFAGVVPIDFGGGYGIYNVSDEVMTLANWYPILAVYDEQGWNLDPPSDMGDSVYSDMAFYTVTLTVPSNLVVAATGVAAAPEVDADLSRYRFVSGPARDFLISLSPNFDVINETVAGVQINSYFLPGHAAAGESALNVAILSLQSFNQRFGPYPYTELDVVEIPMQYASGVEFPGIILIATSQYEDPSQAAFSVTVAHEVAHQWWYNMVGNDVFEHPWLDEALTTYSSSLFYEDGMGAGPDSGLVQYWQQRYEQLKDQGEDAPVAESLEYFETDPNPRKYSAVVYTKGALFFHALRKEIGDEAFFGALQAYYQDRAFKIAQPENLLEAFETAAGRQLDDFYQQWLYSPDA